MTTKLCKSCQEEKPSEAFHANARNSDGLQSYCKACNLAKQAAKRAQQAVKTKYCPQCTPEFIYTNNGRQPSGYQPLPTTNFAKHSRICKACVASNKEQKELLREQSQLENTPVHLIGITNIEQIEAIPELYEHYYGRRTTAKDFSGLTEFSTAYELNENRRGRLATTHGAFLKKLKDVWQRDHNKVLENYLDMSLGVFLGYNKPYLTRCKIHDLIWAASPRTLLQGCGCYLCQRDKRQEYADLLKTLTDYANSTPSIPKTGSLRNRLQLPDLRHETIYAYLNDFDLIQHDSIPTYQDLKTVCQHLPGYIMLLDTNTVLEHRIRANKKVTLLNTTSQTAERLSVGELIDRFGLFADM